jgi:DNA (cytosine-5)-methyltransferase 1
MNVLDLFSGIGGFSLGLERAGMTTVAFCEIEEFPRRVLRKHWPDVPIYEDVRDVTGHRLAADGIAVDVITGGFPCQDISIAGNQAGISDSTRSGLWSEIARLVGEVRPKYVIVENVTNLLSGPSEQRGQWFGKILGDLAEVGYDAEWHCIPAAYIGAKHHRDRVWIVAYPQQIQWVRGVLSENDGAKGDGRKEAVRHQNGVRFEMGPALRSLCSKWVDQPDPDRMADGVSDWPHRLAACGNAVVPQIPEMIGRAIMAAHT